MTKPSLPRAVLLVITSCLVTGCSFGVAPSFELFGAFFPAWMLCAVAGVVAAVVIRQVLMVVGVGEYVVAPLLTYVGLALSATWLIWLSMFGH